MLTEFHVKNFKSIRDLRLELGRVTVLIGENGSGKSNILEALALAAAAAVNKLDHEFLASRGIRTTEPRFMRSAFEPGNTENIEITTVIDELHWQFTLSSTGEGPYDKWYGKISGDGVPKHPPRAEKIVEDLLDAFLDIGALADAVGASDIASPSRSDIQAFMKARAVRRAFGEFLAYSPENTSLRNFEQEGQILPLGVKGEGLFQLLKTLAADEARMAELRENLRLIDWFEDIRVATDLAPFERRIGIRDRYLAADDAGLAYFDQRSSNEGFLFLLFYFTLLVSPATPKLFAIDNIDASLNPKLCTELMRRMVALAVKHDKQMLITTHNPAVLDGLDLNDDQQRLYAVYRNSKGHTKARRISPPKPIGDEPPIKLSEAFLRGLLGGLPQNF